MLNEILEIPGRAKEFIGKSGAFSLPEKVPYVGMGSSYFASVAFRYMGLEIYPEVASEYYHYVSRSVKRNLGVILSQSGRSSEALWCTNRFEHYLAITNDPQSPLCNQPGCAGVLALHAGEEKFSSSKTYINTLLTLFKGFGFDINNAMRLIADKMQEYEHIGKELADRIFHLLRSQPARSIYITGNGPNVATAMQAALILSECTKIGFNGLAMAQYDHGPKETAKNSIVLMINAAGEAAERTEKLAVTIRNAGAEVFIINEPKSSEQFSILYNILPLNFLAYYLAEKMQVKGTFVVGSKITEI